MEAIGETLDGSDEKSATMLRKKMGRALKTIQNLCDEEFVELVYGLVVVGGDGSDFRMGMNIPIKL